MKRIYLDYAASTPVAPEVLRAMLPYFGNSPARHARPRAGIAGWGNPGSLHSFGQEAIKAVDDSREVIAKAIGAKFEEIIFTGSATEANNLALRGSIRGITQTVRRTTQKNFSVSPREVSANQRPRIIISAIEHKSVFETALDLESEGIEVVILPVDKSGVVDLNELKKALNERTVLVSVMYANNEIGTIQPISAIAEIVKEFRMKKLELSKNHSKFQIPNSIFPLVHTDAVHAFQFLDCDVSKLGIDLMTLSAHKIYGPKGVGALYVRNHKSQITNHKQIQKTNGRNSKFWDLEFGARNLPAVAPLVTGGGQEFGLRSGTENVPGIVGFAEATKLISNSRELENKRIRELRDYFWQGLRDICPTAQTNADYTQTDAERSPRKSALSPRLRQGFGGQARRSATLPNIVNVYFPDHEAQFLLTKLDASGVAASSGSACRSRAVEASYVIEAMGYSQGRAKRSVRFSFGRPTTKEEIDRALNIIKNNLNLTK